jgi:sulfite reductase (NADPH) hemoprotein beta-component
MSVTPSVSSVARIAYLASDVIINSEPALPKMSAFGKEFDSIARESSRYALVDSLPAGADPGSAILRRQSVNLISFTCPSNGRVLNSLLARMAELSSMPLALHVHVFDDLTDVLLLRSAIPFFLLSCSAQQAHDNALLASRLARTEKKAVLHAFYVGGLDEAVDEIPAEKLQPFLLAEKPSAPHINGDRKHSDLNPPPSGHTADSSEYLQAYESAAVATVALVRRTILPLTAHFHQQDSQTVVVIVGRATLPRHVAGVSFVTLSLLNPFPCSRFLAAMPGSISRVFVFEQVHRWSITKWTPLYLNVLSTLQSREGTRKLSVRCGILGNTADLAASDILDAIQDASRLDPCSRLQLGVPPIEPTPTPDSPHVPRHESSYIKILKHLFGERLDISNSPSLVTAQGELATNPEFALGRVRGQLDQRAELTQTIQELLESGEVDEELHSLLGRWVNMRADDVKCRTIGDAIVASLKSAPISHPAAARILSLQVHFRNFSRWIIGSDAWSYDLGSSGLHHAIASGLNVNILILDTLPYTARQSADPSRRKRDVGLYAMNHGDVYVASVAMYSSYSQVLQALVEADRFDGPSVVLAYLPYYNEDTPALKVLQETKLGVDSGYWPLYRWNPRKDREGKEAFILDSDIIKADLQQFLDRQNHLSQLVRSQPQFAADLMGSLAESVRDARRKKAQQAYEELLSAIDSPPLLVLYASDGGSAEKVAKRLANRGKARGLATRVATLDSIPLGDLAEEEHVVFITSVAGQGEPPQNGRTFFKAINAAVARNEQILTKLRFSVFGMGDSHYWPRPEDVHYYNKPGKDLNDRLAQLGGQRIADLGLGDDQDADGPETGYRIWETLVWKALGVDSIEVQEAEPEPITNEHIKAASNYLRGTIVEGLEDLSTGAIAPSDGQLTKFHGIYQQDDRDIRDERQAQGVEPAYSFMIRVRMPGGVCKPDQWLQIDQIADEHGNGTFKITTRQTFQFHGVIKKHLKPSIQAINRALLDTIAACGDVNR